jgi:hypothetical protein
VGQGGKVRRHEIRVNHRARSTNCRSVNLVRAKVGFGGSANGCPRQLSPATDMEPVWLGAEMGHEETHALQQTQRVTPFPWSHRRVRLPEQRGD